MQENHTRNLKLKEENVDLATKLKSLVEQYERREEVIIAIHPHYHIIFAIWSYKIVVGGLILWPKQDLCEKPDDRNRDTHKHYLLQVHDMANKSFS